MNEAGGFNELADDGKPMAITHGHLRQRQIHTTTRMVHCFAIAKLMGRPGAQNFIDHGMEYIWNVHRDAHHGGYMWGVAEDGPVNDAKQAYGHAFILLAASSAKVAGHRDADRLLADVSTIIHERFWEKQYGVSAEQFKRDWSNFDHYRGQNSNMHLTESLMAAFEATHDNTYLDMAVSIAERIINTNARSMGWRLPEHFHADWTVDKEHNGDPMFRPYGSTPGHWLEWTRLLLQLWELSSRKHAWMVEAAKGMFQLSCVEGWDKTYGGFYYTIKWDGTPSVPDRYWWPCAEGIGAAAFLNDKFDDPSFEDWYRRIWDFTASHFIDKKHGGWFPQLNIALQASNDPFFGKPDLYHALQACMIPLLPTTGSVTKGLSEG